ncbi:MAG: endo-1,4-beta-xylanase, partial [Phreatobacter sp.]
MGTLLATPAAAQAPLRPPSQWLFPFGAALRDGPLAGEPDYRAAIVRHCRQVVGEGGLKWFDLRPSRDRFVFDQADKQLAFAAENGMDLRGHTLVWYGAMPDWTKTIASAAEAERELVRHIETVVGRYRGRIKSWDVVNE